MSCSALPLSLTARLNRITFKLAAIKCWQVEIMQIGCNPLLHLLLKRQQPALEFCCSLSFGRLVDNIDRRPLFERPMATDQLNYITAFGITDRIDRRIKLASASAEGKAVPVTNRPSLGQTCIAEAQMDFASSSLMQS